MTIPAIAPEEREAESSGESSWASVFWGPAEVRVDEVERGAEVKAGVEDEDEMVSEVEVGKGEEEEVLGASRLDMSTGQAEALGSAADRERYVSFDISGEISHIDRKSTRLNSNHWE